MVYVKKMLSFPFLISLDDLAPLIALTSLTFVGDIPIVERELKQLSSQGVKQTA